MAKIIYLIGASGSGKDSLLSALRQQLDDKNLMVAHRFITRDWQSGNENHIQLSMSEFQLRQEQGLFALSWQANGLHYGIGREIDLWLDAGLTVVINGSREYLPTAMTLYGEQLCPVMITVDEAILRQRLINRGRENQEDIESRLTRLKQTQSTLKDRCHIITNNHTIDDAVVQLYAYIDIVTKYIQEE